MVRAVTRLMTGCSAAASMVAIKALRSAKRRVLEVKVGFMAQSYDSSGVEKRDICRLFQQFRTPKRRGCRVGAAGMNSSFMAQDGVFGLPVPQAVRRWRTS
jgi:hypothetical protein